MRRRIPRDIDRAIEDLATHPVDIVTPKVLAAWERCDVRTIIRLVETGTLVGYKVGREWRIITDSARQQFPRPSHAA